MKIDSPLSASSARSTVLRYFDQISEAPDAIPRLRRFILDLAVRGKLVEQDLNGSSGSDLLPLVRRNKEQLMVERNIRREKDVEYSYPETLFEIPPTWAWAYVDDVAIVQGGKRLPKGATFSKDSTPHIYIRVTDMKKGTISSDDLHYISPTVQKTISRYIINQEDLYITIAGTIGQVGEVPAFFDGHNLTENAAKIVFRGINRDYFCLVLNSDFVQNQYRDKTKQMAQPKLALKRILGAKFPFPPLAEQHRIVTKADELMKMCDELKAAQQRREKRRDRLITASLSKLTDEIENKSILKFSISSACSAVSRPEHIHQLRQTILSFAVRGKLVPQNPNDEPASELLKRINTWRLEAVTKSLIRNPRKLLKKIDSHGIPYALPKVWTWARLAHLPQFGEKIRKYREDFQELSNDFNL